MPILLLPTNHASVSANIAEHRSRLTDGQVALLQRFPDLYFEVYQTHRSASYPDYVYQAIKTNASRAELMKYGAGVTGATMSSPFPVPENGLEVLWNHTLRFTLWPIPLLHHR